MVSSLLINIVIVFHCLVYLQVWDPLQVTQVKKVETMQRRAARFVKGDYSSCSSVSDMLKDLKCLTLQKRCYISRTCLFHKAVDKIIAADIPCYIMTPLQAIRMKSASIYQ